MYEELCGIIRSVNNLYYKKLLSSFFLEDKEFEKRFKFHSAAKTVHHGFVGGLLEHTLSVTKHCDYFAAYYPMLNRDLIVTAAIFLTSENWKNYLFSRKMITQTKDSC